MFICSQNMVVERTRAIKKGEQGIRGTWETEGGVTLSATAGRWNPAENRTQAQMRA